jgi:fructokinase
VSTDAFGRQLVKRLQTADVDTSLVIDSDDLTALAFVHTDDQGIADYSFYMNGTAEVGLQPDDIPDTLHPDALHVGSISLVIEPMASTIAGLMQRLSPSATITMDPNVRSQFISDRDAYRARLHNLLAVTHFVKIIIASNRTRILFTLQNHGLAAAPRS